VQPFIKFLDSLSPDYHYQVIPYSFYAVVYNLVGNSMFSTVTDPVTCHGDNCVSYLLSGGVLMATPWIPTGYPSYSLVKINDVPAMQLEFDSSPGLDNFSDRDCDVFGSGDTMIAIRFCVVKGGATPGSLRAGKILPIRTHDNLYLSLTV
jgi:hypothetical protein